MKCITERRKPYYMPRPKNVLEPELIHEPEHKLGHEDAPPQPQEPYLGGTFDMLVLSLYVDSMAKYTWEGDASYVLLYLFQLACSTC